VSREGYEGNEVKWQADCSSLIAHFSFGNPVATSVSEWLRSVAHLLSLIFHFSLGDPETGDYERERVVPTAETLDPLLIAYRLPLPKERCKAVDPGGEFRFNKASRVF
jgi:hypothetical protein